MKKTKNGRRTLWLALWALFVALITVGAFIKVPISIIPITLQTLFVLLSGQLLGKKGWVAVLAYIILGLVGVPVFTAGGGFSYVLQPTFGYILGFAVGSFLCGLLSERSVPADNQKSQPTYLRLLVASLVGLAAIYTIGLLYFFLISRFYLHTFTGVWNLLLTGFLLTVPGDIALCVLGSLLAKKLLPILRKMLN